MARFAQRRAVFLDRDGVLNIPEFRNGRSYAPRRLEDFRLYDDAVESVRRLKNAGYLVIAVTNQPDVSTGRLERETLAAMHKQLVSKTRIDAVEVCFSTRDTPCRRRKPEPGMLIDAALAARIDLDESVMVGDRAGDIEAGRAAGCATVFIDHGYTSERTPTAQDATVRRLGEAVDWILTSQHFEGDAPSRNAQSKGASNVRFL